MQVDSPYLARLRNRIDLHQTPFTDRGSRVLVLQTVPPHQLAIRLAERWAKRDGPLNDYTKRPPLVEGWQFTDSEGRPLEFTLTTYPHCVECRTAIGTFTLTFVDAETLLVALPPAICGLTFRANVDEARTDRRGGVMRLVGAINRSIAYTTNALLTRNEAVALAPASHVIHLACDATDGGQAILINITPSLCLNRSVPDPDSALTAAARRWHKWFAAAPAVADDYRPHYDYAWWVMAAGLVAPRDYVTREALMPSKIKYIGIWQWDAYFHSLAYRHVDMRLAKDQIRIMLDHQRADGMIPDAIHDEGVITRLPHPVDGDVTKPPLLAWAAWKLHEQDGDREFLKEIYGPVVRLNAWWVEHNDSNGGGLCEYQHPYSSGLDDSPLWDEGGPVESPDLNTYLCLQQEALAKIAAAIGEKAEAEEWGQRAEALAQRLIRLRWDSEAGLFWAMKSGRRVDVRTPFNLFPIITGRMPREITARLVAHLTDEREFWTPYPAATAARNHPKYDPQTMWRGPVWMNVNYLLIEGLQRSGQLDVARELRGRTLAMIMGEDEIYEYYNPETGKHLPEAASAFGWSAALFIDLAIQASREAMQ